MESRWLPPQHPYGWNYRPPLKVSASVVKPATPPKPAASAPLKTATKTLTIHGSKDEDAATRVNLLISKVIRPAQTVNLSWTRGVLGEALGKTPTEVTKFTENGHNKAGLVNRIFEWVRSRIRYVNDPVGKDLFTELPIVLKNGIGDCDDFAALLSALLIAAGIHTRLRIIQIRPNGGWAHIYPLALLDGKWRALDATEKWRMGWEFPRATKKKDFEVKV